MSPGGSLSLGTAWGQGDVGVKWPRGWAKPFLDGSSGFRDESSGPGMAQTTLKMGQSGPGMAYVALGTG